MAWKENHSIQTKEMQRADRSVEESTGHASVDWIDVL